MKSIYKTVDYQFKELPKPEDIELEIASQEADGWRCMGRTGLTPKSMDKPMMMMTITYQSIAEMEEGVELMDDQLAEDLSMYGQSWVSRSKDVMGNVTKERVHPNKVRLSSNWNKESKQKS